MAKRPNCALHRLFARRRSRPTSRADGPGYLYAFVDHGHLWKLGMTNNFDRRKAEWDRRCPSPDRRWMPPIAVRRRRRADLAFAAFGAGETTSRSSSFPLNGHSYGEELSCRYFLGLQGRELSPDSCSVPVWLSSAKFFFIGSSSTNVSTNGSLAHAYCFIVIWVDADADGDMEVDGGGDLETFDLNLTEAGNDTQEPPPLSASRRCITM
ncbi:hypothetical protein F5878DRAFT_646116 [Lentinula raphanica]|uniref:Uncharacterized protein n=1 Tax=Lentinula raphanica TaxID=153919 RepID=A0AA38NZ02_9AGAR|nr:hypothetical protein F5878DRAFT_646116 [Lentinula raphanica]